MQDYNQKIEYGSISNIFGFIPKCNKILVISGSGLESQIASNLFLEISKSLSDVEIKSISIPQGEDAKTLEIAKMLWTMFAKYGLDRQSLVIAVGGGSVSDLCGFACSNYMRGIRFACVPTTLLSMIDASIGGKNAVNADFGKNMIGTFYLPYFTYIDVSLLDSLSLEQYQDGLFEAMKICFTFGEHLFDYLCSNIEELKCFNKKNVDAIGKFIKLCGHKKDDICKQDPYDNNGIRQVLNYGHTLAHAIEAYFNYEKISHGVAVALGMDFATFLASNLKIAAPDIRDKQREVFMQLDLLDRVDNLYMSLKKVNIDGILDYLKMDKKARSKQINFVVLKDIGCWEKLSISLAELKDNLLEYIKS